jgi:GMP synthase (glutamine-hydrolysing)
VAAEPLGTLDPLILRRGHRIRFVNFHREPDAQPDLAPDYRAVDAPG